MAKTSHAQSNPAPSHIQRRAFDILRHIIKTYSSNFQSNRPGARTRHSTNSHRAQGVCVCVSRHVLYASTKLFIWRFIAYDFDGSATLCDGFIAPDFISLLILYVLFIDWCSSRSLTPAAAAARPETRARKWFNVFYLRAYMRVCVCISRSSHLDKRREEAQKEKHTTKFLLQWFLNHKSFS